MQAVVKVSYILEKSDPSFIFWRLQTGSDRARLHFFASDILQYEGDPGCMLMMSHRKNIGKGEYGQ